MTKEGGLCFFYSVTVTYGFDVEIGRCGFCEDCDSLWVFGKIINVFCFRTKEKEKEKKHSN